MTKKIKKHMIVLFGSTGDLTKKKIIPALYELYKKGVLNVQIICVARKEYTDNEYLKFLGIEKYEKKFKDLIHYNKLDFASDDSINEFSNYIKLVDRKKKCGGNLLFYLATPANLFKPITEMLNNSNIIGGPGFKRVVFEKPFGNDLGSAKKLNKCVSSVFSEDQIFRIDHYLGKELVQNIIVLRFANSIFEHIWNNKFIDNIQIVVSENMGVGTRGGYYENSGAVRDFVQNHLLQLLALVAMDSPLSMDADDIRNEKVKVLKNLKKVSLSDISLGQYSGSIINGKKVGSYRSEEKVDKNSNVETFIALKAEVNNRRWKGVPFYLKTGKMLDTRFAQVNIVLKDVFCRLYFGKQCEHNVISIRIQPDEGISIRINSKLPNSLDLIPVNLDFCHECEFGISTPEAYEKLLFDVMNGDQTLLTRIDEVLESWKFTDPLISCMKKLKKDFPNYKPGSKGPKSSLELLKKDGREWIDINNNHTNKNKSNHK